MSKAGIKIDSSGLKAALARAKLTSQDLLDIEVNGQKVLINGMRMRVPVDTGATKASIMSHIVEQGNNRVVDDVGPSTVYAPAIEYGRDDMPGYPAQPFIRPTVEEDGPQVQAAISAAFAEKIKQKK